MDSSISKNDIHTLFELIEDNESIIVFRHVNPDGDAYGSQWGLVQFLKDRYPSKIVVGVGQNNGSTKALFPEPDDINDDLIKNSLVIVTDTSNRERIDDQRYRLGKTIVKIDHHPSSDDYGHLNMVDSDKSSACELLTEIIRTVMDGVPVSVKCATYLFTGMKTDTLSFSTHKVTWSTFDLASYLLKSGSINLAALSDEIQSVTANIFDYVTYLRLNAQSELGRQLIYVYIEPNILEKYQITSSIAKEYVNTFKQIKEAKVWAILVNEGGTYNVSLRSRFFPINDLAKKYGGGGHMVAAATKDLTFEQTQALLNDLKSRIKANSP